MPLRFSLASPLSALLLAVATAVSQPASPAVRSPSSVAISPDARSAAWTLSAGGSTQILLGTRRRQPGQNDLGNRLLCQLLACLVP